MAVCTERRRVSHEEPRIGRGLHPGGAGPDPWAILGVGGFLGVAEKLVAIPMEQLALTNGKFILKGATKDTLKAMPEFKDRTST